MVTHPGCRITGIPVSRSRRILSRITRMVHCSDPVCWHEQIHPETSIDDIKSIEMNYLLKVISFIGLGLTIIPSLLVLAGKIDIDLNKTLMIVGTVLWFSTVPFWINKNKEDVKSRI